MPECIPQQRGQTSSEMAGPLESADGGDLE